jgi:DNA-binding CsgD family transcriptional regulator
MEQAVFDRSPLTAPISQFVAAMHGAASRTAERADGDASSFFGGHSAMLQTILDHVHFGVTVVGPQFRLVFANKAALRECARHPLLRIDGGRLVLQESKHAAEVSRALSAARSGRWSLVQLAHGEERMMLAVLPLWPHAATADAPALLVFGLPAHCKRLAIQFYAQSHGLSPAETQVLRALGEGLSPKEIARQHAVAMSTVRTQLSSVRTKTGARSITELVLTLGCLPPIMPAALSAV